MAADELVRVRIGSIEKNMGRSLAEASGVTILDEPVRNDDGTFRDDTAKDGRPLKPRTSVDEAAEKSAAPAASKKKESDA